MILDIAGVSTRQLPASEYTALEPHNPSGVRDGPRHEWPGTPDIGQQLSGDQRYRLLDAIGRGGMCTVYRGEHIQSGRIVAIKLLHATLATDVELVARFRREAQVLSALESPHVVRVFDVGQLASGADYIVMEYLQGADLGRVVRREVPLSVTYAVAIAQQLCEALTAVHASGIVHRDVKPENVFLAGDDASNATVKLLDFGVCRAQESARPLTQAGLLLGTPSYMAPEQIDARSFDARADIHALGAVLFFMLTGRPPFEARNLARLLISIAEDPAPLLRDFNADVPVELELVVERALAKQPEHRYPDARALSAALQTACGAGSHLG